MHADLLSTLALVLLLGVGAQWLASALRAPSILLLLLAGFLAGPVLGLLVPDEVFGELLFPVTSLSVALILFEGGLTLDFGELRGAGRVIRNLVTLGALVTWVLAALAAHWTLDLGPGPAALLGAILVVTGPTVVGPLLRHVNATGRVAAIAKWEGILIDPIGATLAVLVFEALLARGIGQATALALGGLVATLLVGTVAGLVGAGLVVLALRRARAPEHLHNALVLMLVAGVHALSNRLQDESGLFAVTLMGVVLANQRRVDVRHVREFKRSLQVLLLAGLFVVLAARMDFVQLRELGWKSLIFLGLVVFAIRPLAVAVSAWRTDLTWSERLFLAGLAPRGIVAAAVSALFSLRLAEEGMERASLIASATFLVIVGTVVFYALTAGPLARRLGLATRDPQGVLVLGAHEWARQLGLVLAEEGLPVVLWDTNWASVSRARVSGLEAQYGNLLGDEALERLALAGTRHFLALTSNPEVNALACVRMAEPMGRTNVYRLPAPPDLAPERSSVARDLGGRVLFGPDATWERISERLRTGAVFKRTRLSEDFDLERFREHYGPDAWVLFVHAASGALVPVTTEERAAPRPGDSLIALVNPREPEEAPAPARAHATPRARSARLSLLPPPRPLLRGTLPAVGGRLEALAEDFEVEELPLFPPTGAGEHVLVRLRRAGWTTEAVVDALARRLALDPRAVGFAGRKDKHALATQALSLPWPLARPLEAVREAVAEQGFELLALERTAAKLRLGQHAGNRFGVRLRGLDEGAHERAAAILERLAAQGFPNAFGPQRYGKDGSNAERGLALLRAGGRPRHARERLFLSAWQSERFDRWLALRMERGDFARLLAGDLAQRVGRRATFPVLDPALEEPRMLAGEITYTGPLLGADCARASGEAGRFEEELLAEAGVGERELARARLPGARRAARIPLPPIELRAEPGALHLAFTLPPGAYATSLLEELCRPDDARVPDATHAYTGPPAWLRPRRERTDEARAAAAPEAPADAHGPSCEDSPSSP